MIKIPGQVTIKGQLISKSFLRSSISSKKRTKTRRSVVKTNSFIRFLEEIDDTKNHFEITWPLVRIDFFHYETTKSKKQTAILRILTDYRACQVTNNDDSVLGTGRAPL